MRPDPPMVGNCQRDAIPEREVNREQFGVVIPMPEDPTEALPSAPAAPSAATEPLTPEVQSVRRRDALHMVSVIEGLITRELLGHPAVIAHPEWMGIVARCVAALTDLRAAIGATQGDDNG